MKFLKVCKSKEEAHMLFLKSILDQHWFKPLDFPLLFFLGGLGYCRLRVLTECVVLTSAIQ
jgi:hypothetical protein